MLVRRTTNLTQSPDSRESCELTMTKKPTWGKSSESSCETRQVNPWKETAD